MLFGIVCWLIGIIMLTCLSITLDWSFIPVQSASFYEWTLFFLTEIIIFYGGFKFAFSFYLYRLNKKREKEISKLLKSKEGREQIAKTMIMTKGRM